MSSLLKKKFVSGSSKSDIIRRKHKRIGVGGVTGDIADGNFVLEGIVEDISSGGVKISHLPPTFSSLNQSYRIIVSGNGKHYRILVRPCWTKIDKLTKTIEAGFKVVEASWEWEEFVIGESSNPGFGRDTEFHA